MVYSIIKKSQLEGANRLDAEYYQPEYLEAIKKLECLQTNKLGEMAFITDGEHGSPIWDENSGIRYFSGQYVEEGYLNSENINFISKIINDKNKRTQLKEGNILLSIVGRIGIAGIVDIEDLPANTDRNVATIKITDNKFLPEFIVVFLNSKYGRFQTIREVAGNVQPIIILSKVRELLIPRFSIQTQKIISSTFQSSIKQLKNSKKLYSRAEKLLLEELGLNDFKPKEDLSFVVNYSDVKKADRMDADYFQPKYAELINKLGKTEKLSKIAKRKTDLTKTNKETEYKYIEISDINVSNGEVLSNVVLGKDLPANAKMKINGGELIISKVRPTRGAISIIPDGWQENYVASGAFSVFEINNPEKEFLQVVLRSIIGKLQMEKPTTGTSYPTVTDEDVENILIPFLPESIQQKIAELVRKSHEARKKSKELLEEAKRKVEEMIEKGDKK